MTSTPHDALFKSTFSDRDNAIAELRAVLPSALVARLDFSTLEVESGGYVDPELSARFSDIVYRVTVGDTLVRILRALRAPEPARCGHAGHIADESERDELVAVFKSLGPGPEEHAMRSVAELFRDEARAEAEAKGRAEGEAKGRAEGEAKGRAEGEAKGRAEGLRATLRKLMKLKFGGVSDAVSARIDAAAIEDLERWVERILVATSAEEVIGG